MYIIHQRDIIRNVLNLFNMNYNRKDDSYKFWDGTTVGEKRSRFAALDLETCSAEDVNKISSGWADNNCDECNESHKMIIHFGDEPGYEAHDQKLCLGCLEKGVALLSALKETK